MVIPTQGVVVELGAGVTWTANSLANRGYRVIACDISSEKLVGLSSSDVFMRNSGTHYERILCDMSLTLPFRDSSVDAVIALGAIHHAHNIHLTFKESCRVLKPGGMLGVVEVSRSIFLPKIFDTFGAQEKEQYHRNENRYSLLEYAGFAAQANMIMRVLPAPSTVKKLSMLLEGQGLSNIASTKYKLALMFRPVLRSSAVRSRLLGGSFFKLLNWVFGIQFIGLFAKRPPSG
jgi:ubiquinone/menaquinone biosynthesis C-methylase UbiE